MNYSKIQAALDTSLASIAGIPPIAFENFEFESTPPSSWLRTRFLAGDRAQRSLGLDLAGKPIHQRYSGIYQIIINTSIGDGIAATNQIYGLITSVFDAAQTLSPQGGVYVSILKNEKMRAYQESPWYKTPVNIHWYTYTQ
jgi:hypothetical protein